VSPDDNRPWRGDDDRARQMAASIKAARRLLLILLPLAIVVALPVWIWFFCRIEPGANELTVLLRKTGTDLSSGQIVATEPGQKGIQLDVLSPGRYFYNPFTWSWEIVPITDVPAGKLGVVTRLYGTDLPPGEIIAEEGSKGILHEVLAPGKYYLNPFAVDVQMYDAISIRAGYVGVQTSLVGADSLAGNMAAEAREMLTVQVGMKGVLTKVLDPGTYYLNPYLYTVVEVNLQSRRFEMSGDDAITFLTIDGFTVHVEGTIEYAIQREMAAELTHRVGDADDILKKVILPRARGFSRIEGSKSPAINYIVGETRQKFQDNLEEHLAEGCRDWGVLIKSILVRNISPPDEIASIIRDREVAVQNAKKFEQQIEQARSQAELTKQEMLAVQNKEKVEAETAQIRAVILANQDRSVRLVAAQKELEVAKLENDAATAQAESIRLKAAADQEVIRLTNEADASVIANQVKAFNTGETLARFELYRNLAPRIATILTSDDPKSLGGMLTTFSTPATGGTKEVK